MTQCRLLGSDSSLSGAGSFRTLIAVQMREPAMKAMSTNRPGAITSAAIWSQRDDVGDACPVAGEAAVREDGAEYPD